MRKVKILLVVFWCIVVGGLLYWLNFTHFELYKNLEYGFTVSFPEDFRIKTEPYSVNNSDNFDFIITDSNNIEYLKIRAYKKPIDYKEPSGPFPKTVSNEKSGSETNQYIFNGITGFKTEGAVEGGGGTFSYFEFVHNGKVWVIEFSAEEGNYYGQSYNKNIYSKIRDSFSLIELK